MSGKNPLGNGKEPQSYEGTVAQFPISGFTVIKSKVDPGTNKKFPVTSIWINYIAGTCWVQVQPGVWIALGSGSGNVLSVTGTANQVLAAPTTGNVILSLVGPYTPATYTAHGVLIGEGTSSIVATSAGTAGQLLTSGGAGSDPTWTTATFPATAGATGTILRSNGTNWVASTDTYPNTSTAGALIAATATNVIGEIIDVAVGQVLMSGGAGVVPAYSGSPSVSGSLTAATTVTATLGAITATNGNLVLGSAGNKLVIHATTAASDSVGTSAALDGASPSQLVVATTAVKTASKIFLSYATAGGTQGALSVGTIVDSTSFQIKSSANGDTSTVNYLIIN